MAQFGNYAATPKNPGARIATANTNRDGTGTLGTVATGGTGGTRIDTLVLQAGATTTAGMLRLFLDDGTNKRLFKEIPVQAITPSGTVAAWQRTLSAGSDGEFPLVLGAGVSLKAGTHNAESFDISATFAGDF